MIVADHRRRYLAAVVGDRFGGMRLHHQIADGEDQPLVVDHDAGAVALLTEIVDGAAIRVDVGLDPDDRRQQVFGHGLGAVTLREGGTGRGGLQHRTETSSSTTRSGSDIRIKPSIGHRLEFSNHSSKTNANYRGTMRPAHKALRRPRPRFDRATGPNHVKIASTGLFYPVPPRTTHPEKEKT